MVGTAVRAMPAHIHNYIAALSAQGPYTLGVRALQVVKHHHARMLGPSKRVELVVAVLAHLQESVTTVIQRALEGRIWVRRICSNIL